jgi:hypothetical protein
MGQIEQNGRVRRYGVRIPTSSLPFVPLEDRPPRPSGPPQDKTPRVDVRKFMAMYGLSESAAYEFLGIGN